MGDSGRGERTRRWYERELGWPTAGDRPVELVTGVRFDVLDVPVAAGLAVLRRIGRTGPVALVGGRALLLVAAGSAEELPGVLDWLEWGGVELDLAVRGAGDRVRAPGVPVRITCEAPGGAAFDGCPAAAGYSTRPVWLRPPEPGRAVEPTLPSLTISSCSVASGGPGATGPVGLVPLVGAVATECHRTRLFPARPRARRVPRPRRSQPRRICQACAFS
jgi:hypothetical protein